MSNTISNSTCMMYLARLSIGLSLIAVLLLFSCNIATWAKGKAGKVEKVKAIQLYDRQLLVSKSSWVLRTRFYDIVDGGSGKYAIFSPKSNKYYQFSSVKEFPSYVIVPGSYRPYVTGEKWVFKRNETIFGIKTAVYARKVKVHARKARTTLLQLEENIDNIKPKRIRIVNGLEEMWFTKEFGNQERLRRLLTQYYGCSSKYGVPLKNRLQFPGCNSEIAKRLITTTKVSSARGWNGFGSIPKGATKGKDFVSVVAGSSGMLDFLYQGK